MIANKITRYAFCLISLTLACTKAEIVNSSKVIFNMYISNRNPKADGTGTVDISVQLNANADDDKRNVIFHTTAGTFLSNKDTIITQKAEYSDGKLYAYVKLLIPNAPATIYLTARPAMSSKYNNLILRDTIVSNEVTATSLTLTSTAVSVSPNFTGEVLITGTLKNEGNVSIGNKVVFEDYLLSGTSGNGRYRLVKNSSDANSSVSAYYSPGNVDIGSDVYIKCSLLDKNGQKSNVYDIIKIAIIPHL